jgi:hypothetical protein
MLSAGERATEPPSFALSGDSVGLLNNGHRVVATPGEFNEMQDPTTFGFACEGKGDGFYFIEKKEYQAKEMPRLYFATTFGAALTQLGSTTPNFFSCSNLTYVSLAKENRLLVPRLAKDVALPKEIKRVPERISIDQHGGAEPVFWTVEGGEWSKPKQTTRWMLLRNEDVWKKMSDTDAQLSLQADANSWTSLRGKNVCVKKIDHLGKMRRCNENNPIGAPTDVSTKPSEERPEALLAARLSTGKRNTAESIVSVSRSDPRMTATKVLLSDVKGSREIVDQDLVGCTPFFTEHALLVCINGSNQSIVRIGEGGKLVVEFRRKGDVGAAEERERVLGLGTKDFFSTSEGGVAIAGSCEGELGNMACVRGPGGKYTTVKFAKPLVDALNRTAPVTYR